MHREELVDAIKSASGEKKPQLVFKNGKIFNVFTGELEEADLAVNDKIIVGIGEYEGEKEIDLNGKTLIPGLIDGHIHIESSMLTPVPFGQAVMPHGTTTVITDPHEIANVAGNDGIRYMLHQAKKTSLDIFIMLPSCVPATDLDESGAVLEAYDLQDFIKKDQVLGLAELMNSFGTIQADKAIVDKIYMAEKAGKLIDGHAPFLSGLGLNAYITSGVDSDHECSDLDEALEKLRRGQWIMIREGTAAQNLEALIDLFKEPYNRRICLVTDDKHPGDLKNLGHIDYIIKKAVSLGAKPEDAVIAGSLNAARRFNLYDRGALAPGYLADIVVVDNINDLNVEEVYKKGKLVAKDGKMTVKEKPAKHNPKKYAKIYSSFNLDPVTEEMLKVPGYGPRMRVAEFIPNQLLTEEIVVPWVEKEGVAPGVDIENDICKVAVFERYRRTGHVGIGFAKGYGLTKGAIASSVAHDSHNLVVAGTNDRDMAAAANRVRENHGGLAVVVDGEVLGDLPLPIGGLMSDQSLDQVDRQLELLKNMTREIGVAEGVDPFMTLAFLCLPVIPRLRVNTLGLIDVDHQSVLPVRFSD